MQDHDRATVLGEPSYGKGLVQRVYTLSSNTGLALTTAFYYTPSGRSIQKPLAFGPTGFEEPSFLKGSFHTDSGREVRGGGGIQPDEVVLPAELSRLEMVLDASGALTSFASEYVRAQRDRRGFRSRRRSCSTSCACFSRSAGSSRASAISLKDRAWIQSRLKQEIVNLKFGVAKGDEIEMQRDVVVQAALKKLR